MAKRYARINFVNGSTALGATNLNKMDKGIDDIDNELEKKIDKSSISNNIKDNDASKVASTKTTYDLNINKQADLKYHIRAELKSGTINDFVKRKMVDEGYNGGTILLTGYKPSDTYNGNAYGMVKWVKSAYNIALLTFIQDSMYTVAFRSINTGGNKDTGWTTNLTADMLVQNTQISDATKPASSVATASLQQQINENIKPRPVNILSLNSEYGTFASGIIYKMGYEVQINIGYFTKKTIPIGTEFTLMTLDNAKHAPTVEICSNATVGGTNLLLFVRIGVDGIVRITNYTGVDIRLNATVCINLRYLTANLNY